MEIGVDTGGTFTDIVGRMPGAASRILKIPSTPADPSIAVLTGINMVLSQAQCPAEHVTRIVHGTTVATNAVLQRRGACTGLITTAGFRDTLEIGRQIRTAIYDLELKPETPVFLAPGSRRKEVSERISATGELVSALDEAAVLRAADELINGGCEAIAICFLFSFLNPTHEQRAAELIRARHPGVYLSLSSEVDPAFREYERTVVTTFDAYVKPVLDKYLSTMARQLRESALQAPLQVMQSRGGVSAASTATQRPVRLFLSGPAAGVIGAAQTGSDANINDVITVDIGGTSCDIALVSAGKPLVRPEGLIDGYPVRVPMVDVNAIGSGGGSIAWLDSAGGLRVGPHSAGSDPGPACYARGGSEATVTDASIVLGLLNPQYFAGGSVTLDAELAYQAIEQSIAIPLGLSVSEAAHGIHRVVNAQMAEGMRLVSIKQGFDPRDFALVALGGAGPVHATSLAEELSIARVIIPAHPGVLSAEGLLSAPIEHEVACAFPKDLDDSSLEAISAAFAALDARCAKLMAAEEAGAKEVEIEHHADICYVGQSHYLQVPVRLDADDPCAHLYAAFIATHEKVFGYATESPARLVNLRSVHRVTSQSSEAHSLTLKAIPRVTPRADTSRVAVFDNPEQPGEIVVGEVAVIDRNSLTAGRTLLGPVIVEQADTTTVVNPGWSVNALESGQLLLERQNEGLLAHD